MPYKNKEDRVANDKKNIEKIRARDRLRDLGSERRAQKANNSKRYALVNKEKIKAYEKEKYEKNKKKIKAKSAAWQKDNKARHGEFIKAWVKNNPAKVNAYQRLRYANKINRTPLWANKEYMRLWYELAKMESQRTGMPVEVDHIVPLQGRLVSGLHCEHNMQLLFKSNNCSKGNKYDVGNE